MYIIPAIDLIEGHCVRLVQGQYDKKINYESDPVKQAQAFIDEGAQWLHIVDLEGAKAGKPVNTKAISSIAAIGKLKIEVGGGLRSEDSIKQLLDIGVTRAIIGTRAITDFAWFSEMAEKFPHQIILGLDARGTKIATEGWLEDSSESLLEFARKAAQLPLAAIIYTDISKDGMMAGPNLERTQALVEAVGIPVIASGGVTTIEDVRKTAQTGAAAAIIGRSLYEGTIKLSEAIKTAQE
jgi:phosphoribosylformimino-5-aminoimidazole carboxamide ribotide isomerase